MRVKVAYISKLNHPWWVSMHFPLTGFFFKEAHVTFCGSGGIRSTARPGLPYPCVSQAKSLFFFFLILV